MCLCVIALERRLFLQCMSTREHVFCHTVISATFGNSNHYTLSLITTLSNQI